jgi:iron complex transport system substrate-binding protein
MNGPRVVSLLASATEIVCALGCRDALVARSHECDFPEDVAHLPSVTETKIAHHRSSAAIDREVRTIVEQGLSVYRVDAERLRALKPDVIVTQTQCEVCAVSFKDLEGALADWTGAAPHVVPLAPYALADVWRDVARVADALSVSEKGRGLVASFEARIDAIAAKTRTLGAHPRVACVEWIDPLMAGGNWVPELVELAGGRNLFGAPGVHSPWLEWDTLRASDPDVILILPCGFGIPRIRTEMPALTRLPGWPSLEAVKRGQVYRLDGNQYFNRSGPHLVESLEILAEILHPETFRFGHEGRGWERAGGPGTSPVHGR